MRGSSIPLSKDHKGDTKNQESLIPIPMSEVEAANLDLSAGWEQALWVNCYLPQSTFQQSGNLLYQEVHPDA